MKIPGGRGNAGFTLLEVLIAVAVLAVGVVAVVNLFPVGLLAARRTSDFTRVAMLAQKQMEIYRAYGYDEVNLLYEYGYPDDGGAEAFPQPNGDYSWRLDRDIITSNLLEATLRIYWVDRGRETYETFITYIARYD